MGADVSAPVPLTVEERDFLTCNKPHANRPWSRHFLLPRYEATVQAVEAERDAEHARAERYREALGEQRHLVDVATYEFGLQHPVECRCRGVLALPAAERCRQMIVAPQGHTLAILTANSLVCVYDVSYRGLASHLDASNRKRPVTVRCPQIEVCMT